MLFRHLVQDTKAHTDTEVDMNHHHHQAFLNVLEDIRQNVTGLQRHIEGRNFADRQDLRVEVLTGAVLVPEAREV